MGVLLHLLLLSGRFSTNNPSALRVVEESNMLIMGSGTLPLLQLSIKCPVFMVFSEVLSNSSFTLRGRSYRMTLLAQADLQSDDIHLYDQTDNTTTRVSRSSFGTPAAQALNAPGSIPSPPSNRFPAISGNGRYVFFSSDSWGREGLSFFSSNQQPSDSSITRDVFMRDLKTFSVIEPTASLNLLYPSADLVRTLLHKRGFLLLQGMKALIGLIMLLWS